jgi:hypothetical protein
MLRDEKLAGRVGNLGHLPVFVAYRMLTCPCGLFDCVPA